MSIRWTLRATPPVTSQYHISDLDAASSTMYFGYVDQEGDWYIMQLNTTNGTARYCKGGRRLRDSLDRQRPRSTTTIFQTCGE